MAKKNRAVILTEYIAVRVFLAFVSFLPWKVAGLIGKFLGYLCYYLIPRRTALLKQNLKNAFPKITDEQIKKISYGVWQNIGMTFMEFTKMPYINKGNMGKFVELKGLEYLDAAAAKKKGVILLGAHYFNWELINMALNLSGYKLSVLAKPLDNPMLNKLVTDMRQSCGATVIFHRQAVKEGLRHLKNNGVMGILIDQHYTSDTEVVFFGMKAQSSALISVFVDRVGSAVVPVRSYRANGKLIVEISPEVKFPEFVSKERYFTQSTQILTNIIENWIREKPEGWFWVHKRWRR